VVNALTEWVYGGGAFIGVGEPSAIDGFDTLFKMAHVFGVDMDSAASYCHGRWQYVVEDVAGLIPAGVELGSARVRLTDGEARVLAERGANPALTINSFGRGAGVYVSSLIPGLTKPGLGKPTENSRLANTRLLLNIILYASGEALEQDCVTDCPDVECAYFMEAESLVLINNSDTPKYAGTSVKGRRFEFELGAFETKIIPYA
jgi:beta-D-galactosyl-(1->4)-L-rhamnose phosphorylase